MPMNDPEESSYNNRCLSVGGPISHTPYSSYIAFRIDHHSALSVNVVVSKYVPFSPRKKAPNPGISDPYPISIRKAPSLPDDETQNELQVRFSCWDGRKVTVQAHH